MPKLIKIDETSYPDIFEKNIDKYIFIDESKNIIGESIIDNRLEYNKIKIKITEKYRSNGYGSELFKKMIEEYKNNYDESQLTFVVDNRERINIILYKAGAITIGNRDGIATCVLSLN